MIRNYEKVTSSYPATIGHSLVPLEIVFIYKILQQCFYLPVMVRYAKCESRVSGDSFVSNINSLMFPLKRFLFS